MEEETKRIIQLGYVLASVHVMDGDELGRAAQEFMHLLIKNYPELEYPKDF